MSFFPSSVGIRNFVTAIRKKLNTVTFPGPSHSHSSQGRLLCESKAATPALWEMRESTLNSSRVASGSEYRDEIPQVQSLVGDYVSLCEKSDCKIAQRLPSYFKQTDVDGRMMPIR